MKTSFVAQVVVCGLLVIFFTPNRSFWGKKQTNKQKISGIRDSLKSAVLIFHINPGGYPGAMRGQSSGTTCIAAALVSIFSRQQPNLLQLWHTVTQSHR